MNVPVWPSGHNLNLNASFEPLTVAATIATNDTDVINMNHRETQKRTRRRLSPAARKREILAATRQVVERHGYHGASVPRVVAVAATAQGNFYRHFKNLDEAFLAVVRELLAPIMAAASGLEFPQVATSEQVETVFLGFYRQLAALLRADAILLREALLVGQAAQGPVGREVTAFLTQMRAVAESLLETHAGRPPFRSTMNPGIVAGAIVGMVVGAVQEAALLGDAFDPEAWAVEMARLETGALVEPAPRPRRAP